jgi:hypothetical protein
MRAPSGPTVNLWGMSPGPEACSPAPSSAPKLHVIRNEPDAHPSVAEAGEELEASLTALVDAAGIAATDRAVVRAMVDLGTWQALRDQGLAPAEAVDAVSQMLAARMTPA